MSDLALTPERRILNILEVVAFEIRPCIFCKTTLYRVRSNGKIISYTAAGVNHLEDCPRFQQQPLAPEQNSLFPNGPSPVSGFDPKQ